MSTAGLPSPCFFHVSAETFVFRSCSLVLFEIEVLNASDLKAVFDGLVKNEVISGYTHILTTLSWIREE